MYNCTHRLTEWWKRQMCLNKSRIVRCLGLLQTCRTCRGTLYVGQCHYQMWNKAAISFPYCSSIHPTSETPKEIHTDTLSWMYCLSAHVMEINQKVLNHFRKLFISFMKIKVKTHIIYKIWHTKVFRNTKSSLWITVQQAHWLIYHMSSRNTALTKQLYKKTDVKLILYHKHFSTLNYVSKCSGNKMNSKVLMPLDDKEEFLMKTSQ